LTGIVESYVEGQLVNTACVNASEINPSKPETQDDCDDATVTVVKETTPKFACEELKVTSIDKDEQLPYDVRFDAKASATDGAVIQGYIWNFGDSKTIETTNATVNHSYTAVGNYTATVQVKTSAGTTAISSKCSVAVKVTEKTPVIECKDLKVELSGTVAPIIAKFTVTAKVENAVVESYIFSFGDGSADVTSAINTTTHTYAKAGEYTASAKIKTDKGTTETGNCKVVIKANEKPVCPYNPNLPIDHPDCKEVVTPPTPPTPPKQPTPEAPIQEVMPSILPKTGTEAVAVMGGTGMMFGAARIYAGSRKERLSKLLRR
jgi:PKD repeat protein